jgi:hypothetical protein
MENLVLHAIVVNHIHNLHPVLLPVRVRLTFFIALIHHIEDRECGRILLMHFGPEHENVSPCVSLCKWSCYSAVSLCLTQNVLILLIKHIQVLVHTLTRGKFVRRRSLNIFQILGVLGAVRGVPISQVQWVRHQKWYTELYSLIDFLYFENLLGL